MAVCNDKKHYCIECEELTPYELKKVSYKKIIRNKEYLFEVTKAYCKNCGNEVLIPGIMDNRAKEIDKQYREAEGLVSIEDITNLMKLYNIGKSPLSLALGFGEITITRYLQGQIPSKEYSDVMKNALQDPNYMRELLQKNREEIGDTAYRKAMDAVDKLSPISSVPEKLLEVISYIFKITSDITDLALQKILYYIQGIYVVLHGVWIFEENFEAWVHGPVFDSVYDMFKVFGYTPIDDSRFAILKNRGNNLSETEKKVIDLVVNTFGMYSGKTLESLTHKEDPWLIAREGYLDNEPSKEVISKSSIREYFEKINKKYSLSTEDGIKKYISHQLELI